MPLDESRYRTREKARVTGAKIMKMLDVYVQKRRGGDDILPKTEVLWGRVITAIIALVILSTMGCWFVLRR